MTASDLVIAIRPVVEALEALRVTFYLTGSGVADLLERAFADADG